ncbi:HRDC domain-containing protein, partial [Streptomyces oceani]
ASGVGSVERGGTAPSRRRKGPIRCRVCGRTLTDAGEMKLMRCEGCPSDLDEALYERLREWRSVQAKELGQPAYCVFTDKTLMAIAEAVPATEAELSRISGVGARKLSRFGDEVLSLCAGEFEGAGQFEGAGEGEDLPSAHASTDSEADASQQGVFGGDDQGQRDVLSAVTEETEK